jgi:hypothetical protein
VRPRISSCPVRQVVIQRKLREKSDEFAQLASEADTAKKKVEKGNEWAAKASALRAKNKEARPRTRLFPQAVTTGLPRPSVRFRTASFRSAYGGAQLTEKLTHFEGLSEQLQNMRCDLEGVKKQCEEESRRAWTAEKDKDRLTSEVLAKEGELARQVPCYNA